MERSEQDQKKSVPLLDTTQTEGSSGLWWVFEGLEGCQGLFKCCPGVKRLPPPPPPPTTLRREPRISVSNRPPNRLISGQ